MVKGVIAWNGLQIRCFWGLAQYPWLRSRWHTVALNLDPCVDTLPAARYLCVGVSCPPGRPIIADALTLRTAAKQTLLCHWPVPHSAIDVCPLGGSYAIEVVESPTRTKGPQYTGSAKAGSPPWRWPT